MLVDVAYVGNKADDLLLVANYNQAVPNSPTTNIPLASRRPISTFGDITYVFNGGKSRYKAFQAKYEWRMGDGGHAPQLADAVEGGGQFGRRARESEWQLPGAAGPPESGRGLRPRLLPPAVQQHDELRRGAALRPRQTLGQRHSDGARRRRGRLAAGRHQHHHTRRDGDVHLFAGRTVPGVGDHERLLGREQLPPEHHVRSRTRRRVSSRSRSGSIRRASSCRPIRVSRSATRRATTCADRTSGSSTSPPARTSRSAGRRGCSCGSRRSISSIA